MKIAEPMTMITDYIITIYTVILAVLLFRTTNFDSNEGVWFIAIVLIITGIGALLGGSAHGFKPMMPEQLHQKIWKSTTFSIGFAAYFFLLAAIVSSVESELFQIMLIVIATAQLGIYLWWMIDHDEFLYVIINYLIAMVIVIGLKIYSLISFDDPSSLWIIGSIIVSILASVIQAKGIGIHPQYFNHNDLFHVIQLPGFYLLYRAALLSPIFI